MQKQKKKNCKTTTKKLPLNTETNNAKISGMDLPKIPIRLNVSENFVSSNKAKQHSIVEKKRVENHEKFNKEINQANYVLEQLLETCNKMLSISQVGQENSSAVELKTDENLQVIRETKQEVEILNYEKENEVLVKTILVKKKEQQTNKMIESVPKKPEVSSKELEYQEDFEYSADFEANEVSKKPKIYHIIKI